MLFIDLFTIDDLVHLEHEHAEDVFFTIMEGNITAIKNVSIINGSLSISNPDFQDFGDIQEINGSLEVSSNCKKLKSLGRIIKIDGDLNLRFSSIETLSNLKIVNGNINLKDSKILDLGKLEIVNGFMLLSKQMKSRFHFDSIKVTKQIKFYSEYKSTEKEITWLSKCDKTITPWDPGYIYSYDAINHANNAQKDFYQFFKEKFLAQKFIDLESNNSYAFILMFDLLKSFRESNNKNFENSLIQLASNYPITDSYVFDNLMFYYDSIGDYENGFKNYLHRNLIDLTVFSKYDNLIRRNLFNPDIIIRLTGKSFLTEFGQKNIENIKPFIMRLFNDFEQLHTSNFLNVFIDYPVFYKRQKIYPDNNPDFLKGFDPLYYKEFFFSEAEYEYHHQNDLFQINNNFNRGLTHIVEKAIICQLRKFVLKSEDNYRESIGLPKVGEGWISETELYYRISNAFKLEVRQHGRPKWLGMQHFDIYIPELDLAFEYQGIQHEKPVDYFGGIDGLLDTKRRDELKRIKCRENGVTLIYVYPDYKFEDIKQTIQRRIIFKENK
ncbi:MAG: hypothetical protein JXC36_04855 [Candidatus Atribacteria bacterium]|nr:hypothetical protein [Candidatus Atribacteria bacterium]